MLKRDLCPICNDDLVAVNYIRDGITHYRNSCTSCIRKKRKLKPDAPAWSKSGYKKKEVCEVCSFRAKTPKQMSVFYVDGNLKNNNWLNLKTVCANCKIDLVSTKKVAWKPAPILPDF